MVNAIRTETNSLKQMFMHLDEDETTLFYDLHPETKANVKWWLELAMRDRVGQVPVTVLAHTLEMTPMVEIAIVRPKFYRRAMIREAYLLQVFNISPEKVWRRMDDHRAREEITNALNTMLAMKRLGIQHEGFEAAIGQWMMENKNV